MIDEMKKYFDQLYEDKVYTVDGKISSKDIIYNYINILEDITSNYITKDEILKQLDIIMQKINANKRKPIMKVVGEYIKQTLYECPECGAYVFKEYDVRCARCGQLINWDE